MLSFHEVLSAQLVWLIRPARNPPPSNHLVVLLHFVVVVECLLQCFSGHMKQDPVPLECDVLLNQINDSAKTLFTSKPPAFRSTSLTSYVRIALSVTHASFRRVQYQSYLSGHLALAAGPGNLQEDMTSQQLHNLKTDTPSQFRLRAKSVVCTDNPVG